MPDAGWRIGRGWKVIGGDFTKTFFCFHCLQRFFFWRGKSFSIKLKHLFSCVPDVCIKKIVVLLPRNIFYSKQLAPNTEKPNFS